MVLYRRIRAWLRRGRLEAELREELAQHAAWKAESLMADGIDEVEARRRAAVAVGNATRHRESAWGIWGFASLDSLLQDIRYGVRVLAKSPAFTGFAVASLAIGIGAGTAVFSLTDAVLLRTMAVHDPSSLVLMRWTSGPVFPFTSLNGNGKQSETGLASTSFSYAAYRSFRDEASRYLDVLGFADLDQVNAAIDGRAELATAHVVSENYFDVLGVTPQRGRALGAIDSVPTATPAAVISDRFWRRRFGGGDAIGKVVSVNAVPVTIVGIAPASFHGTGQVGSDPDLFLPLMLHSRFMPNDDPILDPNFWWVLMLGRLKPGANVTEARDSLDVLLKRTVASAKPELTPKDLPRVDLEPGARGQLEERDTMRDPLRTMAIVTSIVLLVACANVASLLLARGRSRVRELSIRVAIGASRGRVVRQLLTEAVLLALAGTVVGVLIATWMSAALAPALSQGSEPTEVLTRVDARVLAVATAIAGAAALLFGLLPAFRATDLHVGVGLQTAGRGSIHGSRRRLLPGALVVAQIALSLLLVAGAGLMIRSVWNLERVPLGFDASNLLLFRIDPSLSGYDGQRSMDIYSRVLERLRATPGVTAASLSNHRLISNSSTIAVVSRADETRPPGGSAEMATYERTHLGWNLVVDERFFTTMGIRFVRGRTFSPADEKGAPLVIINRSLARQLFQTDDADDAIGRQIDVGSRRQSHPPLQVIGVVEDARYTSLRAKMPPTAYTYYRQFPEMKNPATFEIRTAVPPYTLVSSVNDIVREIDPNLPVARITTQTEQIERSLRTERLFARLATLLGGVAVLLSAIGLYGLLAYGVARRTPEIGLRMALGAERGVVRWMILRESLTLAIAGLLFGIPTALAGARVLQSMLFGLAPTDPGTITAASLAMLALAIVAGYIPARRASRVEPMTALRTE
jgi:predicted permease